MNDNNNNIVTKSLTQKYEMLATPSRGGSVGTINYVRTTTTTTTTTNGVVGVGERQQNQLQISPEKIKDKVNNDEIVNEGTEEEEEESVVVEEVEPIVLSQSLQPPSKSWIRGLNLGGWLVLERYIVPYQFAITDCHVRGDLCWYPGSLSMPLSSSHTGGTGTGTGFDTMNFTDSNYCNLHICHPYRETIVHEDKKDYPIDEYTLGYSFLNYYSNSENNFTLRNAKGIQIAERWFNTHFTNFITEKDIREVASIGITHLRVPLPHYILGDVLPNEPWIIGQRWEHFIRICQIAATYKIQIWPDLHTAPGSQNGFDNSGQQNNHNWATCTGWSSNPVHVQRTLDILHNITLTMAQSPTIRQVVTGFGLLNEPFKDCNRTVYEQYIEQGKQIVRNNLGEEIGIYVSDMFLASTFNDGEWWLHEPKGTKKQNNLKKTNTRGSSSSKAQTAPTTISSSTPGKDDVPVPVNLNPYHDTYLDSHYYQVFEVTPRNFTPAQHIAYTCQQQYRDVVNCCYEKDHTFLSPFLGNFGLDKEIVPDGIRRIVGEWSAAYNVLPVDKLADMMDSIAYQGEVIEYDRQLNPAVQEFLLNFVQAQMVAYESQQVGISSGWFYWTIKMEGKAFVEWDFLQGIQDGWIPTPLPPPDVSSESWWGSTCYDILLRTNDTSSAIHEVNHNTFPSPESMPSWNYAPIDDDVVQTHGQSLLLPTTSSKKKSTTGPAEEDENSVPPLHNNNRYPLYPPSPLIHHHWYSNFFTYIQNLRSTRATTGDNNNNIDPIYYYYDRVQYQQSIRIEYSIIFFIATCFTFFTIRFWYHRNKSDVNETKRTKYTTITNEVVHVQPSP